MGENYFSATSIGNRAASYAVNGGSLLGNTSTAASAAPFKIDFLGSTVGNATDNVSSGLDWFGNNGVIGSIGTGINAIGNIWNAYNSFKQGTEQLKVMKETNQLARDQYNEETRRYNKREAEHDTATAAQQNTTGAIYSQFASNYEVPQKKESVVERE